MGKGCCNEGDVDAAWQVPSSPPRALAWQRPLPCSTAAVRGQRDPQPPGVVSLLIVSTGRPLLWCHHRLFLDVLDLSGRGRHVWLFPPSPQSSGVSAPGAAMGAALLPPQPAPFPRPQRVEAAGGHPALMPGLLSPTALHPTLT